MAEEQIASNFSDHLSQRIQQYSDVKDTLTDFVLNAEGDLATALEAFSAQQLSRWTKPSLSGLNRSELAIDMFLYEGKVHGKSILDVFLQANPALPTIQQNWVQQWTDSFPGLFVIDSVLKSDGTRGYSSFTLTNWLTQKRYDVWSNPSQASETISRMNPGEIVLARLSPLGWDASAAEGQKAQAAQTDRTWTFSGPMTLLGKLGKPKLAVAIGNFKQWFPHHLYGDAPELKEAAWESVQQHYNDFVAFFGTDNITLSGYELSKQMQAYQAKVTEQQLADAGLDSAKSLKEMAKDAGLSEEEVTEAVETLGKESKLAKQMMESGRSLKMVMPKVTLPEEIRKAEAVTVLVHPKWGQAFLSDYQRLKDLLAQASVENPDPDDKNSTTVLDRLVLKYLENEQVTAYVWQQLVQTHHAPLEVALRRIQQAPSLSLPEQLDEVLAQYGKPMTPELPETASVPLHLHNLFQEALQSVSKGSGQKNSPKNSKTKGKAKKKSGFGS